MSLDFKEEMINMKEDIKDINKKIKNIKEDMKEKIKDIKQDMKTQMIKLRRQMQELEYIRRYQDIKEEIKEIQEVIDDINNNIYGICSEIQDINKEFKDIYQEFKHDEYYQEVKANWYESVDSFDKLGLKEELLRGIYDIGYEKPSPIQQQSIIPIIRGKDTLAQAQSGSGKTASFAIGILQVIDHKSPDTQALILVPSRELGQQIITVIQNLGKYLKISAHLCSDGIGFEEDGIGFEEEGKIIRGGVQIIVGTPSQVYKLISRECMNTEKLKLLVMDEADIILNGGDFKNDTTKVFQKTPSDIYVALFSTTMPHEVLYITKYFMREPAIILVNNNDLILDSIKQFYVPNDLQEWKFETLVELINNVEISQVILFCNNNESVIELSNKLSERCSMASELHSERYSIASELHSEMQQEDRDIIMKDFKNGKFSILITTDLFSRGIDIHQVNLVINYDLPLEKESYIHRIGRSSRFGRKGAVINLVTPESFQLLKDIERIYQTQIIDLPLDVAIISYHLY